jgi:SagB-type dehydrogenase family enzyme
VAEEDERATGFGPASAAVYANSTRPFHPWVRSTGFRTHGLRYRGQSLTNETRIAEDFLINTRYLRHDRETETSVRSYFGDPGVVMTALLGQEESTDAPVLDLPTGVRLRRELGDVLGRRRSQRAYTGDPMPLPYLASIVRSAGAVTGQATVDLIGGGQATVRFRTAPSGGGLYPIDVYVAALRVTGLERGLYRYDPLRDALVRSGDRQVVDDLLATFAVPEELITIGQADAVFLLVGHPWRSMRKYGNRGARYLFIEAGAIAQNIHLATAALGYGSVDCASVYDDEAHEAMRLDGLYQTLLHTVIAGYPG